MNAILEPVGSVGNPIRLDVPEDAWRDTSDTSEGRTEDGSRLLATVAIGPVHFHLEAYEVDEDGRAINEDIEDELDALYRVAGDATDAFETLTIGGRSYVVFMTPFCQ